MNMPVHSCHLSMQALKLPSQPPACLPLLVFRHTHTLKVQSKRRSSHKQIVLAGNTASDGWPSPSPHALVAELFRRGTADCGSRSCGVVPAGSMVLVREDKLPTSHADVVHALERGILVSGDRSIFIGSRHTKQVNCILDSPMVSHRHARLELVCLDDPWWLLNLPRSSDKLYLTDLGSEHGTTVNRVPLVPCMPTELQPGDVVTFGDRNVQYRVVRATPRQSWFAALGWASA